jgi:adenosine deaminase
MVTINTDNIGISNANLTDNFMLLTQMCPSITRLQILQLLRNGLEQAFFDKALKNRLLRLFNEDIYRTIMHLN